MTIIAFEVGVLLALGIFWIITHWNGNPPNHKR